MGLFSKLFKTTPEIAEVRARKADIKQINAHGGPEEVFKMFEEAFREVREPKGYSGHLIENQYLPKSVAKTCALMVLSNIKRDLIVTGKPTSEQLGSIRQHPMFERARSMFLMSDELVTSAEWEGFRPQIEDFVREELDRAIIDNKAILNHQTRNPLLKHIASLKDRSAADWDRWAASETTFPVV
jgi:hypothetical protein